MFTGTYEYWLCRKGRLVVPMPFREHTTKAVIMAGPQQHLLMVTPIQYAEIQAERGSEHLFSSQYAPTASVQNIDPSTGRVLISAVLRRHAGLMPGHEVNVAGDGYFAIIAASATFNPHEVFPQVWSDIGLRTRLPSEALVEENAYLRTQVQMLRANSQETREALLAENEKLRAENTRLKAAVVEAVLERSTR